MKKLVLIVALAGFMSAGATTAFACEGGKCKMEHADKDKKGKKAKKGAAAESCHMATNTTASATDAKTTEKPACCMKKDASKTEATKDTKTQK